MPAQAIRELPVHLCTPSAPDPCLPRGTSHTDVTRPELLAQPPAPHACPLPQTHHLPHGPCCCAFPSALPTTLACQNHSPLAGAAGGTASANGPRARLRPHTSALPVAAVPPPRFPRPVPYMTMQTTLCVHTVLLKRCSQGQRRNVQQASAPPTILCNPTALASRVAGGTVNGFRHQSNSGCLPTSERSHRQPHACPC